MPITITGATLSGVTFNPTAAVVTDPYFMYVPLLLNTTSTNAQQNNTFLDSSSNNFTITRNGTPTQGSFTPYQPSGYWSAQFNGSNQYVSTATGIANFSAGQAYTVECWFYTAISSATGQSIMQGGVDTFSFTLFSSTGGINIGKSNVVDFIATTGSFQPNAWYHIAIARNTSNQTRCWVNGTSVGSTSSDTYAYNDVAPYIGANYNPGAYFNGYLSNLRVVKGTAIYDPTQTTITVPTGPLSAVTNTTLLTFQNNRFIDNSGNSKTVTPVNSTPIQAFQPFSPAASYSAATYGGSGYFNGSTDYLTPTDNAAIQFGSGNFTIEGWVYTPNVGLNVCMYSRSNFAIIIGIIGGHFSFYASSNGSSFNLAGDVNFGIPVSNTWNHIAVVRNGTNINLYANGVLGATVAVGSSSLYESTTPMIGNWTNGSAYFYMNGYISNLRLVKGTAIYTAAFTPPTLPVTAVSGTSLLTNFTNAGIYDAAWQNNALTVGNAQVSTTQYKWGTTSMKFNGDYLSIPSTQAFAFGTGNWTVEAWVYLTAHQDSYLVDFRGGSTNNFGQGFAIQGGITKMYTFSSSPAGDVFGSAVPLNAWNHVAYVRSSNTITMYLNGVANGTLSTTYSQPATSAIIAARYTTAAEFINGYIQDLRITKGVARYTTNFSVPTAAFPTL